MASAGVELVSESVAPAGVKTDAPPVRQPTAEALSHTPPISLKVPKATAKPSSILFGAMLDPRLRLRKAIFVQIREEDGSRLAVWEEISEFGQGTSTSSALDDLARTISELYHRLAADQDRLTSDLRRVWVTLNQYIEKR